MCTKVEERKKNSNQVKKESKLYVQKSHDAKGEKRAYHYTPRRSELQVALTTLRRGLLLSDVVPSPVSVVDHHTSSEAVP